jgi:RsiW-degrading membrane proteinase PrsW (M82 family)
LSEFAAYIALLAYPAIVLLVFDWTGAASRWAAEHKSFFPPSDLTAKQERTGRPLLLGKYVLLFLALRGLAGSGLLQIARVTTHSRPWSVVVTWGIVGGVAMLACRRAISLLSPRAAEAEKHDYFLRGSVALWLGVFFLGGFVEELWRAVCIAVFQQNGYSATSVILLTAFCFGFAHLCGRPSRVSPGGVSAEMVIGLMLGAIFVWSGNLIAAYIAGVIYFTYSFLRVRGILLT